MSAAKIQKTSPALTKADLHQAISQQVGLSKTMANQLVDGLLDQVIANLSQGREVKITGFGSFHLRNKKARTGRNPKTGIDAVISARRVVTFHLSQLLKKSLHEPKA
ncbi:MAG: integration host factor subunit alpha [Alphaproteobacteria bacterium]|nr:integration host factor subunit alpha [Alphaproteobacteria bacterium]